MAAPSLPKLPEELGQARAGNQGVGAGSSAFGTVQELEVLCGPLLNYKGLKNPDSEAPTWCGSVLVVAKPGTFQPTLYLRQCEGASSPEAETNDHVETNGEVESNQEAGTNGHADAFNNTYVNETSNGINIPGRPFTATKLYSDLYKTFWAFAIDLELSAEEARWEYSIPNSSFTYTSFSTKHTQSFFVPASTQSMRMMFHSCNGFSIGTDIDSYCGPALWNDVIRMHERKPFHVMIGGGDQLYNDGVRVEGPLHEWTSEHNPMHRRKYPFSEGLRAKCDMYYFNNYVNWYVSEPFSNINGQVPQLNVWDDHGKLKNDSLVYLTLNQIDIIDGFGSYINDTMKCHVFRGIGGVALKYYRGWLFFNFQEVSSVIDF